MFNAVLTDGASERVAWSLGVLGVHLRERPVNSIDLLPQHRELLGGQSDALLGWLRVEGLLVHVELADADIHLVLELRDRHLLAAVLAVQGDGEPILHAAFDGGRAGAHGRSGGDRL